MSAEIKLLHYSCGYWKFPKVDCTKVVETKFIFMGPCTPIKTTKKAINLKKKKILLKNTNMQRYVNICSWLMTNYFVNLIYFFECIL